MEFGLDDSVDSGSELLLPYGTEERKQDKQLRHDLARFQGLVGTCLLVLVLHLVWQGRSVSTVGQRTVES